MNNEKSKNIIIALLIVIIIILGTLVALFATNKISLNTNTTDENNIQESNSDTENHIDINYEEIAKEKTPTIISLANQNRGAYHYCGEYDSEQTINVENRFYYLSSKFATLNEIKEYLNKTISEELLNKYFDTAYYIEQDGNLYCEITPKGVELAYLRNESMINTFTEVKYTISNEKTDSFSANVEIPYYSLGEDEPNNLLTIKVDFIKTDDDNWIINKYEDSITKR